MEMCKKRRVLFSVFLLIKSLSDITRVQWGTSHLYGVFRLFQKYIFLKADTEKGWYKVLEELEGTFNARVR